MDKTLKNILISLGVGLGVAALFKFAQSQNSSLPDQAPGRLPSGGGSGSTGGESTGSSASDKRVYLVSNKAYNRLYKSAGNTLNAQGNYGSDPITNMGTGVYVGTATNERKNGLVRVYMLLGGKGYYGWVIEANTIAYTEAELGEKLKTGAAKFKSQTDINTILAAFK